MIHRESRKRLAETLRHYVAGQITNDDLDEVRVDWRDRGAIAVHQMAWGLYDDNSQHKATGKHYLNREARRQIARWILFLHSEQEYYWPEYSFIQIINWPLNFLTFGWWERMKKRKWEQFIEAGDFEVWPFCRKEELDFAKRNPKLLGKSMAGLVQPNAGGYGSQARRSSALTLGVATLSSHIMSEISKASSSSASKS